MSATQDHDGEIPDGVQLTPFDEDFRRDPYAVYAKLRARDPVHRDKLSFYENSWTITDYPRVRELLRDNRLSADSRRVGIVRDPRADNPVTRAEPDMMTLDDPDHRRLRGLVEKAFTRRHAEAFRPRIDQTARRLCDALAAHGEFDVVADYAKPLPTIVIAEFIGVDSDHHEDFKRWTDTLLLQGYPQPSEDQWTAIVQADAALRSYMERTIAERRVRPRDDLISRLAAARENHDQLSEDEMVRMCTLLIGAGNFTTTDLIANAILALIQHPAQLRQLSENPALIDGAVEEALRFDAPSLVARRFVLEDIAVAGQTIPAGSVVNLVLASANHDPSVFSQPDAFDFSPQTPKRKPHLSFGQGMHHCLGAPLARLEAQIAVARFFEAFPQPELVDLSRTKTLGFRGCKRLMVKAR